VELLTPIRSVTVTTASYRKYNYYFQKEPINDWVVFVNTNMYVWMWMVAILSSAVAWKILCWNETRDWTKVFRKTFSKTIILGRTEDRRDNVNLKHAEFIRDVVSVSSRGMGVSVSACNVSFTSLEFSVLSIFWVRREITCGYRPVSWHSRFWNTFLYIIYSRNSACYFRWSPRIIGLETIVTVAKNGTL
jgi:hypothetical protein